MQRMLGIAAPLQAAPSSCFAAMTSIPIILALLSAASPSFAYWFADLTLDACYGEPSAQHYGTTPCGSPDGYTSAFVVFESGYEVTEFQGIEFTIDFNVQEGELLPFWYFGSSGCNEGIVVATELPASACSGAVSPWPRQIYSNLDLTLVHAGHERGKLRGQIYQSSPISLAANQRYFGLRLDIPMLASSELDGCATPMELYLSSFSVATTGGVMPYDYSHECRSLALNGANPNILCYTCCCGPGCSPPAETPLARACTTPVAKRTWSTIKALYR